MTHEAMSGEKLVEEYRRWLKGTAYDGAMSSQPMLILGLVEQLQARLAETEVVVRPFAEAGENTPGWANGHNRLSAYPGFCGGLDVDSLRAAASWLAGR